MTFGERMKQLRLDRGITLEELADHFNTTKATLSRYENNHRVVNIEFANNIANFFNVSTDYLLGRVDNPDMCIVEGDDLPDVLKNVDIQYIKMANKLKDKEITEEELEAILKLANFFKDKKEE